MPTLSIRVDDETKKKIDKATVAEGKTAYAEFLRDLIKNDLVLRNEDGVKPPRDERTTTSSPVIRSEDVCNTQEYKQLVMELQLKDELIRGKEAHIVDLQTQIGFQMQQLALPPATEKRKKKRHWWQLTK